MPSKRELHFAKNAEKSAIFHIEDKVISDEEHHVEGIIKNVEFIFPTAPTAQPLYLKKNKEDILNPILLQLSNYSALEKEINGYLDMTRLQIEKYRKKNSKHSQ